MEKVKPKKKKNPLTSKAMAPKKKTSNLKNSKKEDTCQ